ncbi:uncharacterized protein LOC107324675 [Coturnix japonica]|uniref:uncharacterized protein LOC107324675 n=1 Tax=Coturnix japonica TaxID=93934 RepID=UPI000777FE1F|nr:uncharacterized protein LOC107324675 [Coturnix japonica]
MGAAAMALQDSKGSILSSASSTVLCSAWGCTSPQPHQLHLQHPTVQWGGSQPYNPLYPPILGSSVQPQVQRVAPPLVQLWRPTWGCPGMRWMKPTCPNKWVQLCPQLVFGCCPLCKDGPIPPSTAQLMTVVVHQVGAGGHGHLPWLLGRCNGKKHLPPQPGHRNINPAKTCDFCCIWWLFWCTIKAADSWKLGANGSVVPGAGLGLVQELRGGPSSQGVLLLFPPTSPAVQCPLLQAGQHGAFGCRRQQAEEAEVGMRQVRRGKGGEGRGKSNGTAQRKHRMEQENRWEGRRKLPDLDPKPLGWPDPALS